MKAPLGHTEQEAEQEAACPHLWSLHPWYQKQKPNLHARKEMSLTQDFTLCCNKNQGVINHPGGTPSLVSLFTCQVKLYYSLKNYDCWGKTRY